MTNFSDLNNRLNKLTNFAEKKDKPFGDADKKIIDLLIETRLKYAYNFIEVYSDINPKVSEKAKEYYLSKVSIDDIAEFNRNISPYSYDRIELSDEQIAKLIINKYKEKLTKKNKTVTKVKNGVIYPGNVAKRLEEIDSYIWGLKVWHNDSEINEYIFENIAKIVIPKVIDPKCITDIDAEYLEYSNYNHMLKVVYDNYNAIPHYHRERINPYSKGRFDDEDTYEIRSPYSSRFDDDDDNPYASRNPYKDDDEDDNPYAGRF